MRDTVLIVGANGSLGKELYAYYKGFLHFSVFGTSSKRDNLGNNTIHIDFNDVKSFHNFPDIRIKHVIIASGYEPKFNMDAQTMEHVNRMFNIHIIGPILFLKHIKHLLEDSSTITFFSSPAAWQGSYDPSYAAVKGAVNSLVRTLAKDLAPKTRVNALSPSLIEDSTVFEGMTEDFRKRHIERTLNKRLLTLPECVEAVDFIIKSKHFTGQILHLNGGMVLG